ncbi:hypothetical protein Bpfe_021154 [Biomphalaria pfeifferi]|uniref:Uncharacterized protein n=1 Tax=Biomphalaria pfeifferi TaxID=112525 RepID=A0AAD8F2L5_BIOPF|nr:hypothetical protein Bpfe_021154 [Biomphalaria pfeifferi]
MTCHYVLTVVISVSVLLSMVAGAPTNGLTPSNDVARDSDLYTVLVEDNEWPELSSRYIQELSPIEPPEAAEYVHVQDVDDVNKRLQRLSGYSNFLLPEAFRKRGIYDAKRLGK